MIKRSFYALLAVLAVFQVTVAVPSPVAAAPAGAPKVSLIGDSTMAAMRWYSQGGDITNIIANTYELVFDAESCRRLVVTSCVGRTDPVTGTKLRPVSMLPLMQGSLRGKLGQVLVVMTGYDDTSVVSAIDSIMAEAVLQGVNRVLWLTYRSSTTYGYGPYYASHNAKLREALIKYPSLELLDWDGYTRSQSAATQRSWFATDDIHMTRLGATTLSNYIKAALDSRPLSRCLSASAQTGTAPPVGQPNMASAAPAGLINLAPVRVLDTRSAVTGGAAGMVGAGRAVTIDLAGRVPDGTTSVIATVTAVGPCAPGFLTVYECGPLPLISTLNLSPLRTSTNMAVTRLTGTTMCVYVSAATDVVVDLIGAFAPGGAPFHPITAAKLIDTRGGGVTPVPIAPLAAEGQIDVPVVGALGIPAEATAVSATLTVHSPTGPGNALVYPGPCGTPPFTSTLTSTRNRSSASVAIVPIGPNGGLCVVARNAATNISLQINGWFGAGPNGLAMVATAPTRLLDTRLSSGRLTAGASRSLTLPEYRFENVAAIRPDGLSEIVAIGCGLIAPGPQLYAYQYEVTANAALVGPGTSNTQCYSSSSGAHLVVDTTGMFVPIPP